jgi:hypothetical protein
MGGGFSHMCGGVSSKCRREQNHLNNENTAQESARLANEAIVRNYEYNLENAYSNIDHATNTGRRYIIIDEDKCPGNVVRELKRNGYKVNGYALTYYKITW